MSIIEDIGDIAGNLVKAAKVASQEAASPRQTQVQTTKPPVEPPTDESRSLVWDPFAIVEQLGFKDRPSNMTYGTLLQVVQKVPLLQAIIVTRLNQVAKFCRPRNDHFQPGFRPVPVDAEAKLSAADKKFQKGLMDMLWKTGVTDYSMSQDNFPTFVRKVLRDSLTYDQMTYEVVMNAKGLPAKFLAVDAATIRLADTVNITYTDDPEAIHSVQIYDNMVINEFTRGEMAFTVRNPHTNIRMYGYGYSEIEMAINVLTAWLWGFDYNSKFFNQGTVSKGLLNIQGTMNKEQLKSFRRQWYQQVSGVENAWRSPVLNTEGKVEWVDMGASNRDMEFSAWMDFLIKLFGGIFQIDTMELGFKYGDTGQKTMFESGTEAKLTASRDKGLSPLLDHVADSFTRYLIQPIDPDWKFEFVGLDEDSRQDRAALNQQRVKTTHTVNELRAEEGKDPLEGEEYDTVLAPEIIQMKSSREQREMQEQAMAQEGGPEGEGQEGEEDFSFSEDDFSALLDGGDDKPKDVQKSMTPKERRVRMELQV